MEPTIRVPGIKIRFSGSAASILIEPSCWLYFFVFILTFPSQFCYLKIYLFILPFFLVLGSQTQVLTQFWNSLCRLGCSRTHRNLPASATQVLGLKVSTTMHCCKVNLKKWKVRVVSSATDRRNRYPQQTIKWSWGKSKGKRKNCRSQRTQGHHRTTAHSINWPGSQGLTKTKLIIRALSWACPKPCAHGIVCTLVFLWNS